MTLIRHPDFEASLSLSLEPDGQITATGKTHARLGYEVAEPGNEGRQQGVWVRWAWDGKTLTVENDRFGFLPVYYAVDQHTIHVASSIEALLKRGVSRTIDDEAMAVFLRLGQYIGEDTPFKAIRALGPGKRLTWHNGRIEFTQQFHVLPTRVSALSRDQAVMQYGELMQTAVERMLPDTDSGMCVPLSAGRDSRHILYALMRAGRRPENVVTARAMAPRPDTDAEIAAQITAELGLTHRIVEQSANRFADELEKNHLTGFFADEHVQMMPVVRWLREQRAQVTWDGIAGDIFSCGVYDSEEFISGFEDPSFRALITAELGDEGYLDTILKPSALARWPREVAENRLKRELEVFSGLPNPIAPYFFLNRVRRKLALSPYGLLNQNTHVLAPYLDHDLFDTLIGLPLSYFRGREFHSEAIDAFYPEMPRRPYVSVHHGFVNERRDRIWSFAYQCARMALDTGHATTTSSLARRNLLTRLLKASVSSSYGTAMPSHFSKFVVLMHLESTIHGEVH